MLVERVGAPSGARAARAMARARARAADGLGGRTVWCASALPRGREPAEALRTALATPPDGARTAPLSVSADDPLQSLAQRLDGMLRGAAAPSARLRGADRDLYAGGLVAGGTLADGDVRADDVVVVHDPLSALLAQDVRERGGHTVWHVVGAGAPSATVDAAWEFLRGLTSGVDAFVATVLQRTDDGTVVERILAVMPSADRFAERDVVPSGQGQADDLSHRVGWSSVLADVVEQDRDEHVGGMRHARPAVAVR